MDKIQNYFGKFGVLSKIWIKNGKNFGFVIYDNTEGLSRALSCSPHVIDGSVIDVELPQGAGCQIFIGGLTSRPNEDDEVQERLEEYGHILKWQRPLSGGRPAPYAFVTFSSEEAARRAVDA
ncbi:RNA-binding protein squid-like [Homarus americanus]|uniref:RNA-binding protein squid-like n=1 Tax=Homarus americanus TaxID=6706 RepID=UPI001C449392|nr:RNA-binding protein squid-like [Homarus americanus]